MSRRIEIEITSLSGDSATWRAAGAKLPKGVLAASLIPGGPVIGNVYRADIEQYMEGIEVLSVTAPKTASPLDPRNERIELFEIRTLAVGTEDFQRGTHVRIRRRHDNPVARLLVHVHSEAS